MNVPTAGQKRVVILGASGMVGGYALRYALENSAVGSVTSIGRRKLGISHTKLTEVLHRDFADCSALAGGAFGSGRSGLLSRHVYGFGLGRGATHDELAEVMVDIAISGRGERRNLVLEDRDIRAMVKSHNVPMGYPHASV